MKQEYEETIRSSRYMTTVNWIDLIVQAVSLIYIGIISLLLFVIIALSPQHSQDFRYSLKSQHHYNIEQVNPHVGWTLTINPLIFILKVYLHYKGIIAFAGGTHRQWKTRLFSMSSCLFTTQSL